MKDPKDNATVDLLSDAAAPKRGRPVKHADEAARKAAAAEAARQYRARKRAELEARKNPAQPLKSSIIDLSELSPWVKK